MEDNKDPKDATIPLWAWSPFEGSLNSTPDKTPAPKTMEPLSLEEWNATLDELRF